MTDEEAWMHKHLGRLVGWTVSHVVTVRGYEMDEPRFGLVLTKPDNKKDQMFAVIHSDPEGNATGHLEITKERHGT